MYKIILLIIPLLCSCSAIDVKVGVSFRDEQGGEPEITNMPNPMGIVRAEYETEKGNTFFAEHITSIPGDEDGDGLNHAGFLFSF
jgi:hypothetical protein